MSIPECEVASSLAATARHRPKAAVPSRRRAVREVTWPLVSAACFFVAVASMAPTAARAQEREPRGHTYAVGAGLEVLRFRASDGARMGASGPTLAFDYTVGRRWAFAVRGAFMFPLHGSQALDGQGSDGVDLRTNYTSGRSSFDLTLMVVRRLHLHERLDLVVGGGLHVRTLRLVSAEYEPIELITGGLGGIARLERAACTRFYYGGELSLAFDPLDFVNHTHRSVFAAPVALTALVGVRR